MTTDLLPAPADDQPAGRSIPTDPDAMLFESEGAFLLGQSPRTLAEWRRTGDGPPFYRLGKVRSVRYRRADLAAFIESRRRRSTCDPGPQAA